VGLTFLIPRRISVSTLLLAVLWVGAFGHLLIGLGVWQIRHILRPTGEGVDFCVATEGSLVVLPLNGPMDVWATDTWGFRGSFGKLSTGLQTTAYLAPGGKRLILCEDDAYKADETGRSIYLVEVPVGTLIWSLHDQSIYGDVAFTNSGSDLALTCPLRLFNTGSGASLPISKKLAAALDECARTSGRLTLSPDGRCLLFVSRSVLNAWEPFAEIQLWTIVMPKGTEVQDVGFSTDGKLCAIDCGRGEIKLYSSREGRHVTNIHLPSAEHHLRL